MLSCRELNEHHASDYLDGRLPLGKRLSVGMHLAMCGVCRRFMQQLRLVKRVLKEKPATQLPDAEAKPLATRLLATYKQQQENSSG